MSDIGEPIVFNPPEKSRTYHYFIDGTQYSFTLTDVRELVVRDSGTHRLKTGDGLSHIVVPGWLRISLEIADWTV